MRHFHFAFTVAALPFGVLVTPTPTRLIAPAGLPHRRQARLPRAPAHRYRGIGIGFMFSLPTLIRSALRS